MDKELVKGLYIVCLDDGTNVEAWYNPDTGHWLNEAQDTQIGSDGFIDSKVILDTEFIN